MPFSGQSMVVVWKKCNEKGCPRPLVGSPNASISDLICSGQECKSTPEREEKLGDQRPSKLLMIDVLVIWTDQFAAKATGNHGVYSEIWGSLGLLFNRYSGCCPYNMGWSCPEMTSYTSLDFFAYGAGWRLNILWRFVLTFSRCLQPVAQYHSWPQLPHMKCWVLPYD